MLLLMLTLAVLLTWVAAALDPGPCCMPQLRAWAVLLPEVQERYCPRDAAYQQYKHSTGVWCVCCTHCFVGVTMP